MKSEHGNGDATTWGRIRGISRDANSLSTLLPDTGLCTKTRLAQIDFVSPASRVRGSSDANLETGHQAPAWKNLSPSFEK